MLLTLTTTHAPATDLGYLLHKHPARVQAFPLSFGTAHVFYSEVHEARCTACLLLDVDPIGLVRDRRGSKGAGFALEHYINDRPYVASSFMSVAIAQVFQSALAGRSKERPQLAEAALPLRAQLAVVHSRGGEALLRKLFEPLGHALTLQAYPADEKFPEWGESHYFTLTLETHCRLRDLLAHLYVLLPVLDAEKHYWIGEDEVQKLLRHGGEWLTQHPERELIVKRYLKHQTNLTREALRQLTEEDQPDPERELVASAKQEAQLEEKIGLHQQRLGAVTAVLKNAGAKRVLDLGCGEGRLLKVLLAEKEFEAIVGVEVSLRALEFAKQRLRLDRMPPLQQQRLKLLHGSLIYKDHRLSGYDAAALVEVIEHLDPPRLRALERSVFEFARPKTVALTTPNFEYNVKWENLPPGKFRHRDHRFEWTRREFRAWAEALAARHHYAVKFLPVGPEDEILGPPTQMAVFAMQV